MLILKLKLPEETVYYNKLGSMTSAPVPFTPESVKGIQLDLAVTGYVANDAFFAFKLNSPDRSLTTQEQFNLLGKLGFKTVPIQFYPQVAGTVDVLIRQKARYAQYDPVWWDLTTNTEYQVPELATIKDVDWTIDSTGRLIRRLTTDLGLFDVVDHRAPEYYQVGLQIKVDNGIVHPYMTGPIVDPIPTRCPKCNNPLKRFQVASDLPLILKCVAPICKQLAWNEPPIVANKESNNSDSFRDENPEEIVSPVTADNTDPVSDTLENKLKVINMECELSDELLSKIDIVSDTDTSVKADFIVTKTKQSVTKRSRLYSRESGIPLIPVAELEAKVNG